MSKAEELAKKYECSLSYCDRKGQLPSSAYRAGYEQAEKDLALIPEDIGVIFNLVLQCQTKYSATTGCYEEVLELFNKARNERK